MRTDANFGMNFAGSFRRWGPQATVGAQWIPAANTLCVAGKGLGCGLPSVTTLFLHSGVCISRGLVDRLFAQSSPWYV